MLKGFRNILNHAKIKIGFKMGNFILSFYWLTIFDNSLYSFCDEKNAEAYVVNFDRLVAINWSPVLKLVDY